MMSKLHFETAVQQEEEYLKKIYPTAEDVPSCMQLFDTFLSCNGTCSSLTGVRNVDHSAVVNSQVKSLYRYGHMAECGQKLEDLKFCMSNKSLHPEEKYEAWIRRRAEWWARRRMVKSSEDVWQIRTCVSFFSCYSFFLCRTIANLSRTILLSSQICLPVLLLPNAEMSLEAALAVRGWCIMARDFR